MVSMLFKNDFPLFSSYVSGTPSLLCASAQLVPLSFTKKYLFPTQRLCGLLTLSPFSTSIALYRWNETVPANHTSYIFFTCTRIALTKNVAKSEIAFAHESLPKKITIFSFVSILNCWCVHLTINYVGLICYWQCLPNHTSRKTMFICLSGRFPSLNANGSPKIRFTVITSEILKFDKRWASPWFRRNYLFSSFVGCRFFTWWI